MKPIISKRNLKSSVPSVIEKQKELKMPSNKGLEPTFERKIQVPSCFVFLGEWERLPEGAAFQAEPGVVRGGGLLKGQAGASRATAAQPRLLRGCMQGKQALGSWCTAGLQTSRPWQWMHPEIPCTHSFNRYYLDDWRWKPGQVLRTKARGCVQAHPSWGVGRATMYICQHTQNCDHADG